MKNILIFMLMLSTVFTLTGCNKDNEAPSFTLKDNKITVIGNEFNLEDVVDNLEDNFDKRSELTITSDIQTVIDYKENRTYVVKVSVSDSKGNTATKNLIVDYYQTVQAKILSYFKEHGTSFEDGLMVEGVVVDVTFYKVITDSGLQISYTDFDLFILKQSYTEGSSNDVEISIDVSYHTLDLIGVSLHVRNNQSMIYGRDMTTEVDEDFSSVISFDETNLPIEQTRYYETLAATKTTLMMTEFNQFLSGEMGIK